MIDYRPAVVGIGGFTFSWIKFAVEIMPYVQLIIGFLTIVYLIISIIKKCK